MNSYDIEITDAINKIMRESALRGWRDMCDTIQDRKTSLANTIYDDVVAKLNEGGNTVDYYEELAMEDLYSVVLTEVDYAWGN